MIENFTPVTVAQTVKAGPDGQWLLVVGWSNTTEGLRPVVVDRSTYGHPRVLDEPAKYGDPFVSVSIDGGAEVYVSGEVDATVRSPNAKNVVYTSNDC